MISSSIQVNEFRNNASPIEIADTVVALRQKTNEAVDVFYISAVHAGVTSIARACMATDIPLTKYRLVHLLTGSGALDDLLRKVGITKGSTSREFNEFSFFLNQYKTAMWRPVNMQRVKFVFGDIAIGLLAQESKAA